MYGFYGFHRIYAFMNNLDYTNLFSPYDYKKNEEIIYRYFKDKYGKSRVYVSFPRNDT